MDFKKEFIVLFDKIKPNLNIVGAISEKGEIYTFGTDTKVLSTLFELVVTPIIKKIAIKHDLKIELSSEQTVYPDFTLMKSEDDDNKIAIDVKTTYIRFNKKQEPKPIGFTLGSYTSFLRNNTKNILYPYTDYSEHWIIGFIYERVTEGLPTKVTIKELKKLSPPYRRVTFFVQEKYKISGEKPGSGNTANIGSFNSTQISDFDKGNGPFVKHGEKVFKDYWANFDRFPPRKYTTLKDYFIWRKENP